MPSFGTIIADARKKAGLSQKDLAGKLMKEDGKPISPQYLNDIEHDRRNPSGELLIEQFARALNLPKESLMIAAGSLPEEIKKLAAEKIAADRPDQVAKAFKVFRAKIRAK